MSGKVNSSVPELIIFITTSSPSLKLIFSVTIDNYVPSTYTNCSCVPISKNKIPKTGPATTPIDTAKINPLGNKIFLTLLWLELFSSFLGMYLVS